MGRETLADSARIRDSEHQPHRPRFTLGDYATHDLGCPELCLEVNERAFNLDLCELGVIGEQNVSRPKVTWRDDVLELAGPR